MNDRLAAWLRLSLIPGISPGDQLALVRHFGSAERVFTAPHEEIVAGTGEACAALLRQGPAEPMLDHALEWGAAPNHHLIALDDPRYPALLRELAVPPLVLYVQGRVELLQAPGVAIVGSRNASAQGLEDARGFARALSGAGLVVTSGLALGIDAAAHRGGLEAAGSSIAVVGTGADRIYPSRNKDLAHELAQNGAIVSEFALGTPPAKGNFPRRNRLISGLSRGVLVVEAAVNSGSLITARYAAEQGREVFAIPGPIHSPLSKGCHRLIQEGAKLVETAQDIVEELRWGVAAEASAEPEETRDPLLEAMGHAPVCVDELTERTGRAAGSIAAQLSLLQLRGAVAALAGGFFQRLRKIE